MESRPFGSSGRNVSVIGQGTWQLRRPASAARSLRLGIDLGMTHLDTAELYRGAEDVIRDAIRDVPREDLFLVSKVLPQNASFKGTLAACDASLRRLETDHLDGYLLHWRTDDIPLEETLRAMGELADSGKIRHVGVSNFDVADLQEAQAVLGGRRIVCDQVLYHLGARGAENELIPYCEAKGVAVVAYSPFGQANGFPRAGTKGRGVLEEVGLKHAKTPRQAALAFLTRRPGVFAIPKAEREEHVRENAGACFPLAREDVAAIEAAFPLPAPGPLEML